MSILICGLNHKSAPLAIRERLAVDPAQHASYLSAAIDQPAVDEIAIVSTCNRTELVCETQSPRDVIKWLRKSHLTLDVEFDDYVYVHHNRAAVRHLMRVACGLDSMVLGEPQILGQVKQSYQQACDAGTIGPGLSGVFRAVFAATKKVRSNTAIGANPVSLASSAVSLAKQQRQPFEKSHVLLIGAGDTINLTARYCYQAGIRHFIFANRSLNRCAELAKRYRATQISLEEIPKHLPAVDVVFTATNANTPIVDHDMMTSCMALRQQSPMLLIDLAVPRDIAESVGELSHVNLVNVDDLEMIIADGLDERRDAAVHAEQIIELEIEKYQRWKSYLSAVDTIKSYRSGLQNLANDELLRATALLEQGLEPKEVLQQFSRRLINKAMHHPTQRLRQAGTYGRHDILKLAKHLLSD